MCAARSSDAEVIVLERITDFFLGLNAGQWLKIRVSQISNGALALLKGRVDAKNIGSPTDHCAVTASEVLQGTGLRPLHGAVEQPPADARHLHHFFGNFGAHGNRWVQHDTRPGGAQQKRRRQIDSRSTRSLTDAERMSEAIALVRARRQSPSGN